MDKEEIKKKIELARELVGGTPEDPLTQIAFGELFRRLLDESSAMAREEVKSEIKRNALPMQISEFLSSKNMTTHIDRIVSIFYYNHHKGSGPTTVLELGEAYSTARVKPPSNFSDVLAQCIRKGLVVEVKEKKEGKKAWQVTPTGEAFVEEELKR